MTEEVVFRGRFKKGDPRCRGAGRPRLSPEVKALKKLTVEEFVTRFNTLLNKTHKEVFAIAHDAKTDMLTSYICKCLLRGKLYGDYTTLNIMLDRLIGKVPQPLEHSGRNGAPLSLTFDKQDEAL